MFFLCYFGTKIFYASLRTNAIPFFCSSVSCSTCWRYQWINNYDKVKT